MSDVKSKEPATAVDRPSDDTTKRLERLFAEGDRFCERMGLPREFTKTLYRSDDWSFCILSASIVEAALNEILVRGIKFQHDKILIEGSQFANFIERLPMLGRSGRHALAKIIDLPIEFVDFIEALFIVRNAYAHRLSNVTKSVHEIVQDHPERNRLLKIFTGFEGKNAETFMEMAKADAGVTKFAVFEALLRFCLLMNLVAKDTSLT